jgi:hypothetical protein
MKPTDIKQGFEQAKAVRVQIETTWEDATYYSFPRKRDIKYDKTNGEPEPWDVYDDTAIQSNLILAAGLSGYMTNAAQRWFELRSRDVNLMQSSAVRSFFAQSSDIMYATFANSNFYQQIHEVYLDLGVFGTPTLYVEEDEIEDVRFYARNPKEIFIIENAKEVVDMVYRNFKMTAWQAYSFFGKDTCGEKVKKAVEEKQDFNKPFEFIHYVCPRYKRDVNRADSINKPFASYWYSCEDMSILKEGGYDEFPFFVPRFYKNSGETYGYSPAISALSNIKMINKMVELFYKGIELDVYAAWLLEHDSMMGTLDLRGGALNYQKQPLSQGRAVVPLNQQTNKQMGIEFLTRLEDKIRKAFFVDLFMALTKVAEMTATEVIERTQEKMLILGPVLGRMQSELLNPLIIRTFNILQRRGKLPPLPEELQGVDYDIVYVSPLAKAQRSLQAKDMTTFMTIVGQMAQMAPDVLDKLDTDIIVDKLSAILSVDPDIVRADDEIEVIRKNRAQAQEQQARMASMEQMAGIAKDIVPAVSGTSGTGAERAY